MFRCAILQGLVNLFHRVHHERTVRRNRFLEWLTRHQHEPNGMIFCFHLNVITIVKLDEVNCFNGLIGEYAFAFENIGQRGVSAGDGLNEFGIGSQFNVEVKRRGRRSQSRGPDNSVYLSCHNADF